MNKVPLEETAAFLREHRSSESNFDRILARLNEDAANETLNDDVRERLLEICEKSVPAYQKAKESGGTAWPEFERFVSEYEKLVTEAKGETT